MYDEHPSLCMAFRHARAQDAVEGRTVLLARTPRLPTSVCPRCEVFDLQQISRAPEELEPLEYSHVRTPYTRPTDFSANPGGAGGGIHYLLLTPVISPLTTHPFREGAPFQVLLRFRGGVLCGLVLVRYW